MSVPQATSATRRTRRPLVLLLALLATLAAPGAVRAQSAELLRIDSLIAGSRLTEARTALERWRQGPGRRAAATDAAHALLLRGRLATDADSATTAYLEIALGYPSSDAAPEALLRLGQGALAAGDANRAAGFLERLTRDYPGAPQRLAGLIWLARAERARNHGTQACALIAAAARDAPADAPLRPLLAEEQRACTAPPAPTATADRSASHAIQVGAFRDEGAARALAQRLRARGFAARVAFTGRGTLALVRVGSFPDAATAAPVLRRVRQLHRDATLVDDVARERTKR
jgi:cell division septation protein DedD